MTSSAGGRGGEGQALFQQIYLRVAKYRGRGLHSLKGGGGGGVYCRFARSHKINSGISRPHTAPFCQAKRPRV